MLKLKIFTPGPPWSVFKRTVPLSVRKFLGLLKVPVDVDRGGIGEPYILRLPLELLQEIMSLVWVSTLNEAEQIRLMTCLPLVCKAITTAFYQALPQDITFTSRSFYEYYISRISKFNPSHPANVRCRSFQFYVDCTGKEEMFFPYRKGDLGSTPVEDGLAYFNNGKEFHLKGLFPNLTKLVINIHNCWIQDPYQALFPHFMPKTIKDVHINYSFSPVRPWGRPRPLSYLKRITPIPYPSTRHRLKTLTVTGVLHRIEIARMWESLFEIEELVVDGKVLHVGEDVPWALDMSRACDMLQLGCRGIGWYWVKGRPFRPSDLTLVEEYEAGNLLWFTLPPPALPPVKHKRRELLETNDPFRRIRHFKSFSNIHVDIEQMKCPVAIKRTKTIAELPMIDFPYIGTE